MKVIAGDSTVQSKGTIRYLGVIIDDEFDFKHHVEFSGRKASIDSGSAREDEEKNNSQSENVGFPNLIGNTSHVDDERKTMISGFRAVSDAAVFVLVRRISMDLLTD